MKKLFLALVMGAMVFAGALPAMAITNGEPNRNRHPYVGLAVFDINGEPSHRCSVSLLSPTVVLTAGHCTVGTDAARVWFDPVVEGNPSTRSAGPARMTGSPIRTRTSVIHVEEDSRTLLSKTSAS